MNKAHYYFISRILVAAANRDEIYLGRSRLKKGSRRIPNGKTNSTKTRQEKKDLRNETRNVCMRILFQKRGEGIIIN